MNTYLVLWSNLEIRLFHRKLAENALDPISLGKGCFKWKCADLAIGLLVWKGLVSRNWLQNPLTQLFWDEAVSFQLAGIQACKLFESYHLCCRLFKLFENCSLEEKLFFILGNEILAILMVIPADHQRDSGWFCVLILQPFPMCTFYFFLIFGCAGSSLLCGLFSSCSEWGLLSRSCAWASHCGGFSCCGAQALGQEGFAVVASGL